QIAADLRTQIAEGTLPPNGQLPTEAELRERYGVARATVRQALVALVNEGLIVPRAPRGYFVRHREPLHYRPQTEVRPQPASPEMDRFIAEHSEAGRKPEQKIEVVIIEPPDDIASRLHLGQGELVVVRRRIRSLDGEPF